MAGQPFQEMFPILSTPDMARALWFYRDLLGFEVAYQFPPEGEPAYVGLRLGSSELGIGLEPEAASVPPGRFAFWVYGDDCDAAVARLRAAGVTITEEPADQVWGERMATVLDPDGNPVRIANRAA